MTAPTHIVTGLAAVVVVGRLGGPTPDAVCLLAFIVGCLAPDIDGNGVITRPGRILQRYVGRSIAGVLDALFGLISVLINSLFGHRGFIHSPAVAIAIIMLGVHFEHAWLVWFGAGFAAHLFGDAMTVGGVPVWAPLSSKRVSLSRMRTGSATERWLATGLLTFVCVVGWHLLPESVKQTHQAVYDIVVAELVD